jgi:hypothetical protein
MPQLKTFDGRLAVCHVFAARKCLVKGQGRKGPRKHATPDRITRL